MASKNPISVSTDRRTFLKTLGLAAAGLTIVPRHVLGKGFIAPSDTLYIAGIGAGGKGTSDLTGFAASPNARIATFCDVDSRMIKDSINNFPKAKIYTDFREMLEKEHKGIDAVSVSTPDHTHAVATMAAMSLGKHVYVQKPLTYSIDEARKLTEAAKRYQVVTQMGNQAGSDEGVRKMKEMYDTGMIGTVTHVHAWTNRPVWPQGIQLQSGQFDEPPELNWDLWLGPAKKRAYNPAFLPFNWRGWWEYGTGALGDMGCHILDPVFRILPIKYPDAVECSTSTVWEGFFKEAEVTESCPASSIVHLNFPNTDGGNVITLTWLDGGLLPKRPEELLPEEPMGDWDGGVIMEGTKGKLMCGCYGRNPVLLPTRRMQEDPMPEPEIPRVPEGHYLQWVNACLAGYGKMEVSSPFEYAGPFTEAVLMGNLALRSYQVSQKDQRGRNIYPGRKKLLWNAQEMKITNFDEANQYVKREYRKGWEL